MGASTHLCVCSVSPGRTRLPNGTGKTESSEKEGNKSIVARVGLLHATRPMKPQHLPVVHVRRPSHRPSVTLELIARFVFKRAALSEGCARRRRRVNR